MTEINLEPTVFTVDKAIAYAEAVAKRVRQ